MLLYVYVAYGSILSVIFYMSKKINWKYFWQAIGWALCIEIVATIIYVFARSGSLMCNFIDTVRPCSPAEYLPFAFINLFMYNLITFGLPTIVIALVIYLIIEWRSRPVV